MKLAFATRSNIAAKSKQEPVPLTDQIMTLCLLLQRDAYVTMIRTYAPKVKQTMLSIDFTKVFYTVLTERPMEGVEKVWMYLKKMNLISCLHYRI